MKNLNLIKRLWTDSHEKQKVRGMQKYCILLLLLLTCVTHAWAADWHVRGTGSGLSGWDNAAAMRKSTTANVYYIQVSGTCEFKIVGSSGNWQDNEKDNTKIGTAPSNNVSLSASGSNIKGTSSGTWYICYNSSTDKVYGTTATQ